MAFWRGGLVKSSVLLFLDKRVSDGGNNRKREVRRDVDISTGSSGEMTHLLPAILEVTSLWTADSPCIELGYLRQT